MNKENEIGLGMLVVFLCMLVMAINGVFWISVEREIGTIGTLSLQMLGLAFILFTMLKLGNWTKSRPYLLEKLKAGVARIPFASL